MIARHFREVKREFLNIIDCHPRVGWYVAAFGLANVVLNVADLLH